MKKEDIILNTKDLNKAKKQLTEEIVLSKQLIKVLHLMDKDQYKNFNEDKKTLHKFNINGKQYRIIDSDKIKICAGEDYNFLFDKISGNFKRFGYEYEDDPSFSPVGGEILDIEVTTSCKGVPDNRNCVDSSKRGIPVPCSFCYKSNTPNGKNMSFDTFKSIVDVLKSNLGQIAFGADSEASSNPDLWKMMEYARKIGIVPNITVANITDETSDKLATYCGAVAVSRYADKNVCYDSIKKLTDRGMTQINMHFLASIETYDACLETLRDIKSDSRLAKLNAIVLLSLKKKGRGVNFNSLPQDKYDYLVNYCLDNNISFGMDSCGAKKFLDAVKDHPKYKTFSMLAEPCESTNFSQYIDVDGKFYPCSFCENIEGWTDGIDMLKITDYLKDVWYNERVVAFRNKLNSNCDNCHKARECPIYKI